MFYEIIPKERKKTFLITPQSASDEDDIEYFLRQHQAKEDKRK